MKAAPSDKKRQIPQQKTPFYLWKKVHASALNREFTVR
jgi:hypothetical protein